MSDWEIYEQQIFEKFRSKYDNCDFIKNHKIKGLYSNVNRQIDVAIIGNLAGIEQLGVIECKYYNKKIDVKTVDSFIGFIQDVNANFGIIITNQGFSEGATNRAKNQKVHLDIINIEEIDEYEFEPDIGYCEMCDETDRNPIFWDENYSREDEYLLANCQWCSEPHIRCNYCGAETPTSMREDDILKCSGGCGLEVKITEECDRKGYCETHYEVVKWSKKND